MTRPNASIPEGGVLMKKFLASLVASAFLLGAPAIAATTSKKPAAHAVKHAVAKKAAHIKQKTAAKASPKPKAKTPSKMAPKMAPKKAAPKMKASPKAK